MKKAILFFFALLMTTAVFSQEFVINGKVTDASGAPLEGAAVNIKGTSIKALTDSQGDYSIRVRENDVLVVTHMGLSPKEVVVASLTEVVVGNTNIVNIELKPEHSIFDMSLEELMDIRITSVSKREETIKETPQTVIVVSQEELYNRGYTDIEQVFHDLPGFDITRASGTEYSQLYQRGYRSNNTNRTLLLIDGVEANDLWSNSAWVSMQHSLSNVERIEVIYGPSSTVYGANAFLGVVNIITKDASSIIKDGKKFGMNAETVYGSWNTMYADVTAATKHRDFSMVLTGRYYISDMPDLSHYPDWDYDLSVYDLEHYRGILETDDDALAQLAMDYDNQVYYNDPELGGIEPQYANATKDWYVNAKMQFDDFIVGAQSYRITEGYGAWYRDDYELGTKHNASWGPFNSFVYAKYDKQLSSKLTLSSFSSFRTHQLKGDSNEEYYYIGYMNGGLGLNDLLEAPDSVFTWDNEAQQLDTTVHTRDPNPYWWHVWYHVYSQQFRSELRLLYEANERFNIISGIEYRQGHIQGNYIVGYTDVPEETASPVNVPGGNHFAIMDIGAFSQANYYLLDNLNVVLGLRADYNQSRVTGGYGLAFNPKAALVYSPGDFIFKAIYSEAIKDATSWDKYGTVPGRLLNNPSLEPEKVKNYEFTASWQASRNLFIDFAAFNANYSNVIGTAEVSFTDDSGEEVATTQHQALGKFQIQGAHSTLTYRYRNYSTYMNYTFTNPFSIQDDDEKIRIGDIASHQFNIGVNANFFQKLNVNLRGNYVGEKLTGENTTIASNPYSSIDPYLVLHGAVSYKILNGLSAQIVVNNILDNEYFHPGVRSANGGYYASRVPQYERSIMFKLYFEI